MAPSEPSSKGTINSTSKASATAVSVLLRQALDVVLYLLDRQPKRTVLFIVAAVPTAAAFWSVL